MDIKISLLARGVGFSHPSHRLARVLPFSRYKFGGGGSKQHTNNVLQCRRDKKTS